MSTLPIASLLEILDSVATQAQVFQDAIGESDADPGSVAEGAANNVETVFEAIDDDNALGPLVLELQRRQADVTASQLYRTLQGERVQLALDAHYGGTGSLNRALTDANARVHPNLGLVGIQIDAVNRFSPVAVALGAVAVTGSGAGTFTAGDAIDTSEYGNANVELVVTTVIGAAPIVATLTMRRFDGSTTTIGATVPNGSIVGATVAVGTPGTDMFVACMGVTFTGGTNGEGFAVRTTVERAIAL
ncbi:MAG: hypothetical protein ABI634_14020 [Acidobacteriota bacterium]